MLDFIQNLTNRYYGWRSICQHCNQTQLHLIKTEIGTHLCIPCIIVFNQGQIEEQLYTFLCTSCGCFSNKRPEQIANISLTHCDRCLKFYHSLSTSKSQKYKNLVNDIETSLARVRRELVNFNLPRVTEGLEFH